MPGTLGTLWRHPTPGGRHADNFESSRAWTLITIAAAAYIVSRGLSKIGRDGDRND